MGKLNWFAVIATLGMIASCILLVLGDTQAALIGAVLVVGAAIMAHLK